MQKFNPVSYTAVVLLLLFVSLVVLPVRSTSCAVMTYKKLDRFTNLMIVSETSDPTLEMVETPQGWVITLEDVPYLVPRDTQVRAMTQFFSKYTGVKEAEKTARLLIQECDRPLLFAAKAVAESTCNSTKVSPVGAQGKWQVMPSWKKEPGYEFYRGKSSHLNDRLNLKAAMKIYNEKLKEHRGNVWVAVRAYCGGGPDARAHEQKVRKLYAELKAIAPEPHSYIIKG